MHMPATADIPESFAWGEPLLRAQGLCKFYAGREVVHDVSLEVRPREIVTIIGPNGAGKTTLLSCLIGLTAPDRGSVTRAAQLRIGYVPQHFRAPASMPLSVRDFLTLYGPITDALATRLDVAVILDAALNALSGGELRRVLLLRALLRNPQLLVLDEPTQGVDVAGQGEFYRLLQTLADEQHLAVLMVSHDLHVVMASTKRVICLNRHICCEGAPERVGADPQFKALFGADLAKQVALYHHTHTHRHPLHEATAEHHHHAGCDHG